LDGVVEGEERGKGSSTPEKKRRKIRAAVYHKAKKPPPSQRELLGWLDEASSTKRGLK